MPNNDVVHKDAKPSRQRCRKIINGYLCTVSNADLNEIRQRDRLNYDIQRQNETTKLRFISHDGTPVAHAIKIGDSDIRIISDREII